ncbi:DUF1704 domain-containing protein [Patescibacteria group bacterium]|nr:DUF1704 domain-containing protein [Patescibacteria group bacterium]
MSILKNHGILGINARNYLYIRPYNKKKAIRLADDKLKTKQFLSARDISVPKLYAVIRNQEDLDKFDFSALPASFVLKPNLGYGGEGIIPVIGRENGDFVKVSGGRVSLPELIETISDILEGRFSISGMADTAFFEQRIACDDSIEKFSYKGLPDIRVVVHNLIPVMAMLRLPTKESDGKANLHLGAVGVGIDIAKGTATHVVHHNKIVEEIPGIGPIKGFQIPYWDEILLIASKVQLVTNLGYLAADIVVDKNSGPVLLEINARAGLGVQIANLAPLRKRLERIEGVKVNTPEKGVRIAQDMFGNKIEKEVKKISGKEVISSMEKVKVLGGSETRHVWASINPLLDGSIIDRELVDDLGLEIYEDSHKVKVKFSLADIRIQTLANVEDLSGKPFDIVVGRRDLQGFLIDPSKSKKTRTLLPNLKKVKETISKKSGPNYLEIDKKLIAIDRQIKLLYHLKPINILEESHKFFENNEYNPEFIYPEFIFDPFHLKENLKKVEGELDNSALGILYHEKLLEVRAKVELLESIGTENFVEKSEKLFGTPKSELLQSAQEKLDLKPKEFPKPDRMIPMEEAIKEFERVFLDYNLNYWKVKVKKEMVSDCIAGKKNVLFVRQGSIFSPDRVRMVVAHEIETHILTAENGKRQYYEMMNRGFGSYLETQEGLAIWNQEFVIPHDVEKNYRSAVLVFVVNFALSHNFAETYDYCRKLGMKKEKAFRTTVKVKRGIEDTSKSGAFTKEIMYFSGYLQIKSFVENGGDLKDLYYGKFNLKDLEIIKKIPHLREPLLLPKFLS